MHKGKYASVARPVLHEPSDAVGALELQLDGDLSSLNDRAIPRHRLASPGRSVLRSPSRQSISPAQDGGFQDEADAIREEEQQEQAPELGLDQSGEVERSVSFVDGRVSPAKSTQAASLHDLQHGQHLPMDEAGDTEFDLARRASIHSAVSMRSSGSARSHVRFAAADVTDIADPMGSSISQPRSTQIRAEAAAPFVTLVGLKSYNGGTLGPSTGLQQSSEASLPSLFEA